MIIPAFDLINGKPVRLYQGKYLHQTSYDIHVNNVIKDYQLKGVKMVHLVDLDGAKNVKCRQTRLFKKILNQNKMPMQIGGGIRTSKDINFFLQSGANRVVIGSSVIDNREEVKEWLSTYGPDRIVLALDVNINSTNDKLISIHGWQTKTQMSLEEIIEYFLPYGLKHVLCTDIKKDGTLCGPNIQLYKEISSSFKNIIFQASGGISTIKDILSLKKNGAKSVIIGRSLLEKNIHIEEALSCWQNA